LCDDDDDDDKDDDDDDDNNQRLISYIMYLAGTERKFENVLG
jgi:hypothetical protein